VEKEDLRQSYKERIQNLKEIDLNTYLKEGFKLNEESILKAISYFKSCMPSELKPFLLKEEYWNLFYNSKKEEHLIKNLKIDNEEYKKALGVFVYTFNEDKRDFEKLEDENKLREELLKEGFKEFVFNRETYKEESKKLHDLKVFCVFDRNKINFMGSFTQKERHEGKLFYNEQKQILGFLPKRHTRTGHILIGNFYYKEI
jgi:hypothetical protein